MPRLKDGINQQTNDYANIGIDNKREPKKLLLLTESDCLGAGINYGYVCYMYNAKIEFVAAQTLFWDFAFVALTMPLPQGQVYNIYNIVYHFYTSVISRSFQFT